MDRIYGITPEVLATLFAGAPLAPDKAWFGELYRTHDQRELIPFVFAGQQFIVLFLDLVQSAGSAELVQTFANNFANGYVPHADARMVKYCRADGEGAKPFHPEDWKLPDADPQTHAIFQFIEVLAEVTAQHYDIARTPQYFFQTATKQLELLYDRVFRRIDRELLPGVFAPILDDTGDFSGYQAHQI